MKKIIIKNGKGIGLFEIVKDNREYILIILFIKKMVKMLIFFFYQTKTLFFLFFFVDVPLKMLVRGCRNVGH